MPLLFKIIDDDTASTIALWKVTETEEQLLELAKPGTTELTEYSRFSNEQRRVQWLAVRALFREISGVEQSDSIVYQDRKPFLFDGSWHISISHSGCMAAVIINKRKAVGIDIEKMSDKVYTIRRKYLSTEEYKSLGKQDIIDKLNIVWCVKEALYKLLGRQAVNFAEHFVVQPFDLQEKGTVVAEVLFPDLVEIIDLHYQKIEDYYLVYITAKE